MVNLQLIDTLDGGYFVFSRNDYILDEGIYSELYACLFATSTPEWWADTAFNTMASKIASRTENALKTNNSNTKEDANLIIKAIIDDLIRFTKKNTEVLVQKIALILYSNKAIEILIELTGYSDAFNFVYNKTSESLDNITYKAYTCKKPITDNITADTLLISADSTMFTADATKY